MKALYIHGFNSAGFGGKADTLRQAFGADSVINPSLPPNPQAAFALLDYLVSQLHGPDFLILGSSLGGFYALNLALKYPVNTVLVNPAVRDVSPGLAYALGEITNYKTNETYHWTADDLKALDALEISEAGWAQLGQPNSHVRAYLDAEDEVLPAPRIAEFLSAQGIKTQLYPGGNHMFMHMDELLTDVRSWLKLV